MSAYYHEHHARNLARSRDHLTNAIVSLRSAAERMTGDDWIEAMEVLLRLTEETAPRLTGLRKRAQDRLVEYDRSAEADAMRSGRVPYLDERPLLPAPVTIAARPVTELAAAAFPNSHTGAMLVALHGSVDAAMMAYPPDSAEFDHVQAYRYVSTGRRPVGWVPPIVRTLSE